MSESIRCPNCKLHFGRDGFHKNKRNKNGLQSWCKSCNNESGRRFAKANPEKMAHASWKWNIKRKYGIDHEEYQWMVVRQGNLCAICGSANPGGGRKRWQVDHCHSTGAVRGLLCNRCNLGLGYFSDSPATLGRAIAYLGAA